LIFVDTSDTLEVSKLLINKLFPEILFNLVHGIIGFIVLTNKGFLSKTLGIVITLEFLFVSFTTEFDLIDIAFLLSPFGNNGAFQGTNINAFLLSILLTLILLLVLVLVLVLVLIYELLLELVTKGIGFLVLPLGKIE
jgi:hypothetical protein